MAQVLGVDIGASAVKAVLMDDTMQGEKVRKYYYMPYGEMSRAEAVEQFFNTELQEPFERLVVSLKGYEGSVRICELPFDDKRKVESVLPFELETEFADGTDSRTFRFHEINGRRSEGQHSYLVIGVYREIIETFLTEFSQVSQKPFLLDYDAYANFNCYHSSKDKRSEGVKLLVDIGARSTGINIINEEELLYTRSVFFGGRDFTNAIAERLNLPFADAEELKLEYGVSKDGDQKVVVEVLSECLDRLVQEIRLTLGSYSSLQGVPDVECLLIYGGGSMLKGMEDYLQQMIELPVMIADPLKDVHSDEPPPAPAQLFSIAMGLALRGLGEGQVCHDFLPKSVFLDTFSQRRIMMHMGAVCLLAMIFSISSGVRLLSVIYAHYDLKGRYDKETTEILDNQKGKKVYNDVQDLHRRISARKKLLERFSNAERSPLRVLDFLSGKEPQGSELQIQELVLQNEDNQSRMVFVGTVKRAPDLVAWEKVLDSIPKVRKRERAESNTDSKTGRYFFREVLNF